MDNNSINTENIIIENTSYENTTIGIEKKQEEIDTTYADYNQNILAYVLIVTVGILMIFEKVLNHYKIKKQKKDENFDKYKKRMRITWLVYAIYTIIYILITHYALKIPMMSIITLIITSIIILIYEVYIDIPFLKLFKKKKEDV